MKDYIKGNIRKIIFESNTSNYKVGLLKVKETNIEEIKKYENSFINITGFFNEINDDIDYLFYGDVIIHPKYGLQYNVSSYESYVPTDNESIVIYLSSGMFKGIGEKTAKNLVDRFSNDIMDVIKNNYELLAEVKGMSIEKARMIHNKVCENDINQELIVKLNKMGFTVKEAINLFNIYGLEIIKIINENIYELKDNISFDKLDNIFLQNNDEMSIIRIQNLILYNINKICYASGDTLISKEELFIYMKKCFKSNFNIELFLSNIDYLIKGKEIFEINNFITLYETYETENNIINTIKRINNIKSISKEKDIDKYIKKYEKNNNIVFNEEQIDAIKGAIKNNFYIITGGPGTGKTTIIKVIVEILKDLFNININDIALLAPTGRSAKRISESVLSNACTIHKYLKWNKESRRFGLDENNKASESIIIVDEASMIDIFLFNSLLKALRSNVKLILIGDSNQLPSINPGDLLNDLLNKNYIKSKCLNIIYRVKEGSYITYLANDIKTKKQFDDFSNDYTDFKFIKSSDEDIINNLKIICKKVIDKKISIDDFQVLCPMYKSINGIDHLNEIMSDIFNSNKKKYLINDKHYKINDKVIQLINDVENNVFNGDIGYIKDIIVEEKNTFVTIDFSGNIVNYSNGEFDRFTLAYAISIHKAQGSEYDNVVVILSSGFKRMFYNKLIYTAVTRAKSSLIIIGSIESFNSSVKTLYANNRNTYLKYV